MTIELMGMKPTTKRGEKFGRNIHGWGELARYSTIVAPDICAPIRYWLDDSIHEGLDAAGAVALADALQTEIDAGRTAAYAALVHPEDTPQTGPDVLFEAARKPAPLRRERRRLRRLPARKRRLRNLVKLETKENVMEANAHIIAALERLEAAMATPESKEWLASRKEIGRQINPEAAAVTWQFEPVLDPYRICKDLPDQLQLAGREYFARSLDSEDWVSFDDLPKSSRDRLWRRIRAGHFDTSDVELTQAAGVLGVNFNRMMFRPECGPNVSVEGRLAVRNSSRLDISLIVKPSDPEDMIYQLATLPADPHTVLLNGWMPARTAKRLFPLIRVREHCRAFC